MKSLSTKKLLLGLSLVVIIIIVWLFVYGSKNKVYLNEGPAMLPTISNGERIKARVVPATGVKRGDIIVMKSPPSIQGPTKRLVKRVVGLPGDRVVVSNGSLVVTKADGGTYIPYKDNNTTGDISIMVAPNSFFVIGDNRANSLDSRAFGLIPFELLLSVVQK